MPIRHQINDASPHFWSWFAGFMDGDGAIIWDGRAGRKQAKIKITQKDISPLRYIVEQIGVGSICRDERGYHHLALGSYASRECLKRMNGLMVSTVKRERCEEALKWRSVRSYSHFGPSEENPSYAEAMALYASGLGPYQVGQRVGVAGPTVTRWAKKAGIHRG